MVIQVALSLILLIGAGLFVRSLGKLKSLDPGFNRENVLLVSTDAMMVGYRGKQVADLYQRMLEGIKAIPGVRSATFSSDGLFSAGRSMAVFFFRGARLRREDHGSTQDNTGLPLFMRSRARVFRNRRNGDSARARLDRYKITRMRLSVAVINETFARYYFGDENPIGRRFGLRLNQRPDEIVGVVKDAMYDSLREPA